MSTIFLPYQGYFTTNGENFDVQNSLHYTTNMRQYAVDIIMLGLGLEIEHPTDTVDWAKEGF